MTETETTTYITLCEKLKEKHLTLEEVNRIKEKSEAQVKKKSEKGMLKSMPQENED